MPIRWVLLAIATTYHLISTAVERQTKKPPGQLVDIGGYKLHLYSKGRGEVTVVLDHSLGGLDGYFLIEEIAKITRVCIYDRAGYGWSDPSPQTRCSAVIVSELDALLTAAKIEPPYLLVGNSFGSYNVRLYAHRFPEKVAGLVLTDGLHEQGMLAMPRYLKLLKLFFMSGFLMSVLGSTFGMIRLLGTVGVFEAIKPTLRKFSPATLSPVKRSFYRSKHWLTMLREMWNLDLSGSQVSHCRDLGDRPIANIKAKTFLQPAIGNFSWSLKAADRLREMMHGELNKLSSNCEEIAAGNSTHFVWVDEPELIVKAIEGILQRRRRMGS